MALDHLAKLNTEQRRAVEHGVERDGSTFSAPLLVIAGAGSGKTNTLAHRVANLIVPGPRLGGNANPLPGHPPLGDREGLRMQWQGQSFRRGRG